MTSTVAEIVEAANLDSANKTSQKIKDNLDHVLLTEQGLEQIKENLMKMVDAMDHNPSFLARAASYWGEIPLWQKIVGGVVVIVPTLVVAITLQSAIFLAISIFTLITYAVSGFLLDNHYNLNINRTEHLKTGITGLADTLGVVIISLDKLRQQLAVEIEQFQLENEKLGINVKDLGEEVQELVVQRKLLQETVQSLQQTNKELEEIAESLRHGIKVHTQLLEKNEAQLTLARKNYAQAESNLSEKVDELHQVKEDMTERNNTLGLFNDSLKELLDKFTGQLKINQKGQDGFREEIKEMKEIIETKMQNLLDRVSKAELELIPLREKHKKLHEDYQKLSEKYLRILTLQENQVEHLEQLYGMPTKHQKVQQAELLQHVGLYAVETSHPPKKAPVMQEHAEVAVLAHRNP